MEHATARVCRRGETRRRERGRANAMVTNEDGRNRERVFEVVRKKRRSLFPIDAARV
jgi:hypothetical protein